MQTSIYFYYTYIYYKYSKSHQIVSFHTFLTALLQANSFSTPQKYEKRPLLGSLIIII